MAEVTRNPDWSRDETLLALDLYFRHRPTLLDDRHPEVIGLSRLLQDLASVTGVKGTANFRNANGVAMKLGNLSSHDPNGPVGRKGLAQGAKGMESDVWRQFGNDPAGLAHEATRIRGSIVRVRPDPEAPPAAHFRPRIFVTGMWGFNPHREGYVGFTNENIRDRYVATHQPGDLMLVVGQKGEFSEARDVGRVLGLVDLEPVAIHETARLSEETYRAKVERWGRERWQYAMPIAQAWEMASPIKARDLAPVTCAARNARAIGATYLELTDAEVDNVLSARMRPVRVYGADVWNREVLESAPAVVGREALSRGPAPNFGQHVVNREDGPTSMYVMALEGCVAALFPTMTGKRVVKVGYSADTERRQADLNWGFPPGAGAKWVLVKSKVFPSAAEAYAAEQAFLKYLAGRGFSLGAEFAAIPEREFEMLLLMYVDRSVGVVISERGPRR